MCLMPSQKHQIVVRLLRAVVFGADEPQATALDQQRHVHGLARYSPDLVLDFVQPGWRSSSRFP